MKRSSSRTAARPVQLSWSCYGASHRVTAWPEIRFEQTAGAAPLPYAPDPASPAFAAAAPQLNSVQWDRFLYNVPAEERQWLELFGPGRLDALAVLACCPALFAALAETPALMPFLAAHTALRGAASPRWSEINALYERGGIFSMLEWLGLPASRQTLAILGHIAQPDLPRRLLEPLRTMLWAPETIGAIQRRDTLTTQILADCGHALAA